MRPWALGFAGAIYGATAGMCGATIILVALQLRRSSDAEKRPARRLFAFSVLYLFVLFATLLADAAVVHTRPPSVDSYTTRHSGPRPHAGPSSGGRVLLPVFPSVGPDKAHRHPPRTP